MLKKEVLERLGTPFFTTRDEGTGLGVVGALAVFAQHEARWSMRASQVEAPPRWEPSR